MLEVLGNATLLQVNQSRILEGWLPRCLCGALVDLLDPGASLVDQNCYMVLDCCLASQGFVPVQQVFPANKCVAILVDPTTTADEMNVKRGLRGKGPC